MADTTEKEIAQWLIDAVDVEMEEAATIASKIGEDALSISRQEHVYKAQTGNLQSSCGFAVTYNGTTTTTTPFTPAPGNNKPDGQTGSQAGKTYLEECLQRRLEHGVSLTMVAGMNYAGYVEDWGGDVLKSAEAHVRQEFEKWAKGRI